MRFIFVVSMIVGGGEFMKGVVLDYGKKYLVVGDLMLDVYKRGSSVRLSPEAPVPVVKLEGTIFMPGGAGNAAANLASLGCKVDVCGFVGNDVKGRCLREELLKRGVGFDYVKFVDASTITKTRVVVRNQHVVRIDEEVDYNFVLKLPDLKRYDGVIVSDYAKGVVTPEVMKSIYSGGKFVAVDPKPVNARL